METLQVCEVSLPSAGWKEQDDLGEDPLLGQGRTTGPGDPGELGSGHQLRDTFAVAQLLSGTSMQDLSKMLSHKSVKITEKYYSPWVPERPAALERRMAEALVQMGVSVSL
jgi:hypothetical protein